MFHLMLSLAGSGYHPASWRASRLPPSPSATSLYPIVAAEERACMDAILLGYGLESLRAVRNGQANAMHLDPLPLAGALLARTQRIGVVAGWTVDFTEPFHVARVLATLDHLSYGRAGWLVQMFTTDVLTPRIGRSLGTQTLSDYCERADEFIGAVEELWDSWEDAAFVVDKPSGMFVDPDHVHRVDHHGQYFTIRGPLNVPRPPQGYPLLVHTDIDNTEVQRLVAMTADVIVTQCGTAAEAATRSRRLRRLAADRDMGSFRVLADLSVILAPTEAAAQERAAQLDALLAPVSMVPRFVGTPAGLVELFAEWSVAEACDGFNLLPAVLPDDVDLLVDAVIPLARKRGLARGCYTGTTLREHLGLPRPVSQFAESAG